MNVEVDDRAFIDIDGLNRGLRGLAMQAEDSWDFEDILNNAIQSLYRAQPKGQTNYGGESPLVGKVRLCRFNNNQGPGNTNIEYIPGREYKEKFGYLQRKIGQINLRKRTFSVDWDRRINGDTEGDKYNESYYQIPKVLMEDTEQVMKCLRLSKS